MRTSIELAYIHTNVEDTSWAEKAAGIRDQFAKPRKEREGITYQQGKGLEWLQQEGEPIIKRTEVIWNLLSEKVLVIKASAHEVGDGTGKEVSLLEDVGTAKLWYHN